MHLTTEIIRITKVDLNSECFAIDRWHVTNNKVPKKVFGAVAGQFKKIYKM